MDAVLDDYLDTFGGVLLEGARGCGKTSTGLNRAGSSVRLDRSPRMRELADLNPQEVLRGEAPRLVDEWQLAPSLWNSIRHEIDDRQQRGQFILSGSAAPADDISRHTGVGRIGRVRMRPMSLAESGASSRDVSLSAMRKSGEISGRSALSYSDLAAEAVRGGWPGLLGASERQAMLFTRSYIDDLRVSDVPFATGVKHDAERMRRLLESLARNTASEVKLASLAADVSADGGTTAPETVRRYLDALSGVFALEALPAWSVALRSKSRLRTNPKLMLTDPSLACAALGIGASRLARDPEFFGQVFEAMAVRDLRSLADVEGGRLYHYRDNTGLEVDAVIEYPDRSWVAVEVKLGESRIADAEKHLLTLRDQRVDTRVGPADFLAVVTGTEYAYTLPSGVHVVPLAALTA
ncbi:MAG: DUF4143 domain-containing protein [Microbacterium sp.]